MKTLLKQYGFTTDMQYFEHIAYEFATGYPLRAKRDFNAMPHRTKIKFLKAACFTWKSGMSDQQIQSLFDLI